MWGAPVWLGAAETVLAGVVDVIDVVLGVAVVVDAVKSFD